MLPSIFFRSLRMVASFIEAESLIFPYLSRIESMRRIMAGKVMMSVVSRCRAG